jgi:putative ABC transport system permease protein
MLRNYIAAALRNISRSPFYAAISVLGLAVGLCAALLATIVIHGEYHYDDFIPGYERTYLVAHIGDPNNQGLRFTQITSPRVAKAVQLNAPGVEAVARIGAQSVFLRRGNVEAAELVSWADPAIFRVLPFPVFAGNLATALDRPDAVVVTRSRARRYFGREDVIGQTMLLDRKHMLVVTAVLEDLPASRFTTPPFESGFFLSGRAAFSTLTAMDRAPWNADDSEWQMNQVLTYVRLRSDAALSQFNQALPVIVKQAWPRKPGTSVFGLELVRIDRAHTHPRLNPGLRARLVLTATVAALILLVSCINFVNLLTARSATRAKEVAIRKTAGASRLALVAQFIGESFVYVMMAAVLGFAFVEWLLPYVSAFFQSNSRFVWWQQPQLLMWVAIGIVTLAVAVGAYPGVVLSAFRPVGVLKGMNGNTRRANTVRQILVTLQFAVLIGLMIVAGVVWQQREFAMTEALRFNIDQMLILRGECRSALIEALRRLPGVQSVGCSGAHLLGELTGVGFVHRVGAEDVLLAGVPVEFRVLGEYEIKPIAGTLRFAAESGEVPEVASRRYVINESAVRALGFHSPQEAVGQFLTVPHTIMGPSHLETRMEQKEIVAVVPDFSFGSVESQIQPTGYYVPEGPADGGLMHLKLAGGSIPETLAAVDALWLKYGENRPVMRLFADEHVQRLYASMLQQAKGFAVFCAVAMLLACLGLVGLASSIAERRTREIGVRKALGADQGDIVRLLLWQFGKPVLWANLIAWPVAGYLMNRWLEGFAYHAPLQPLLFVGAAAVTLAIALLTVSAHSIRVARAKPVTALRYE